MNWHTISQIDVLQHWKVNADTGLNDSEVEENRLKYGKNELKSRGGKSDFKLLLEQFNNPIIFILIVAAVLNAIISDIKDTFFIIFVIILNTVIGFFQERKASRDLKSLKQLAAPNARVIRKGVQLTIPTSEVVCGDILVLESGMRAPADARLIETNNLIVDESMLTGESFAVHKNANLLFESKASLGDRLNMVYSGTIIQKGRAIAVATEIGSDTEFGKISETIAEADETVSPLQHQIEKFSKGLSIAIMTIVILIFLVGFLRGNDLITMFMTSVGLAVSAIPEGLPVSVTITLSIGVSQMARHKAIVKKLAAVETLGSTNVICTDKTGTLTKNQMTVTRLYCGGTEYKVVGSGYEKAGRVIDKETKKDVHYNSTAALELASYIGEFCTESSLADSGHTWSITGDPTEGALMIAAKKLKVISNDSKVYVDIPFESENQLMAVRTNIDGKCYVLAKGAPEKIIKRCTSMIDPAGNNHPIEPDMINAEIAGLSNDGLRVLALAYSHNCPHDTLTIDALTDLTFVGFAGIEDSVREEVIQAVKDCNNAGVKVVMITGDHVKTASSVSKSVGIGYGKAMPTAVTGQEIDEMTDDEFYKRVTDIDVYARVAPHHKFRIVKNLQAHGNVVAMTGDGVNDAPALKQADIGVAMGSGTDVAREAAHMVLMDDNFATIVQAVRRGRIILHNLQHILLYILSTSMGGLLTIATSVAIGLPLPLLPAQLLWVNLVTDGTSTFPLAYEKEHGDTMAFPPRKKHYPLISKNMILRIIIASFVMMIGTLFVFYYSSPDVFNMTEIEATRARTMAFCVLSFFQIWNVQNSRSQDRSVLFNLPFYEQHKLDRISPRKNKPLLAVMLLALFLQVFAVEVPFMNIFMKTQPLPIQDWFIVVSVTFSIIIIVEMMKYFHARRNETKRKLGTIEMFSV